MRYAMPNITIELIQMHWSKTQRLYGNLRIDYCYWTLKIINNLRSKANQNNEKKHENHNIFIKQEI